MDFLKQPTPQFFFKRLQFVETMYHGITIKNGYTFLLKYIYLRSEHPVKMKLNKNSGVNHFSTSDFRSEIDVSSFTTPGDQNSLFVVAPGAVDNDIFSLNTISDTPKNQITFNIPYHFSEQILFTFNWTVKPFVAKNIDVLVFGYEFISDENERQW